MCILGYVHVSASSQGDQKHQVSLELELQMVVGSPTQELGMGLRSPKWSECLPTEPSAQPPEH